MGDDRHRAITDAQGNYRLRAIRRSYWSGKPMKIKLSVTKEGYGGVDTRTMTFQPPPEGAAQVAEPVELKPGVSLSGTAIDPEGKPLAGAWVQPSGSNASRNQLTKTDDAGRFTVRDLPTGVVHLDLSYGKLTGGDDDRAFPGAGPVTVKLYPVPNE
jgi:hypothetical protein